VRNLPPGMRDGLAEFLESPYYVAAAVLLALLVLLVGFGLALLGALGRAAMVDQAHASEERGRVEVQAGWQAGKRYLWHVFLIRLLLGLPTFVVVAASALPAVGASLLTARQDQPEVVISGLFTVTLALLGCMLPGACLAALFSIPLNVLRSLAIRACVLEGYAVRDSVLRAWTMLREHVGPLAVLWLILAGIGIGAAVLLSLPLVLVTAALVALVWLAMAMAALSPLWLLALTLIIGLPVWLVGSAVHGVVETFLSASWTLAYRELAEMGLTGAENVPTAPSDV